MNRDLWKKSITKYSIPPWPCPVCGIGTIALIRGTGKFEETVASMSLREREGEKWFPDLSEYAFTVWGKCRHDECAQQFCISGNGSDEMVLSEDGYDFEERFYPKQCFPMPEIFEIPHKAPDEVRQVLLQAFQLFWGNTGACANRLRVTLELMLNHEGIQKKKKGANGKFFELTLHQRIEILQSKEPNIGYKLMALKWLGNTGSHFLHAKKDDLLDAFEILEYSLAEMVGSRSKRVAQLAKGLMKKHKKKRRR